jgi:uncharacterized membrane protein YhhN
VTTLAAVLLVFAAVSAVADWFAVDWRDRRLEYVAKPLTIVLLLCVASALEVDNSAARTWFLVALALSLAGDVLLMVPRDLFVPGLAAFLLAHIAYIAGLWTDGVTALAFVLGLAVAAVAVAVIGTRIVEPILTGEHRALAPPVVAYITVISVMVASAIGTREALAIVGASLFYCSDALIAWHRFVRPHDWHRVAIMVTYHAAQVGLTLSLLT